MNEKIKFIIVIVLLAIVSSFIGMWGGCAIQSGRDKAELDRVTKKLSDVLIINKELSEENTGHIETIQRIQELANSSTRSIQLFESGIAELKGIGEAKDIRIIEAERRVRELSEKIGTIESRIDRDAIRITELIEQLRSTSKDNLDRIDSDSGVMWNSNSLNHYKIAEEYRWLRY